VVDERQSNVGEKHKDASGASLFKEKECPIYFRRGCRCNIFSYVCAYRKANISQKLSQRIFLCLIYPIRRVSSLASLIDPLHRHLNTRKSGSLIQYSNLILNLDTSRCRENIGPYSLVEHAIVQNGNVFS